MMLYCIGYIPNSLILELDFFLLFFAFAVSYSMRDRLDLHIESGFVYFTDNSTTTAYRGIFRVNTNGGYYSIVVNTGIGKRGIQGLAVDWVAGMKPSTHPFFRPSLWGGFEEQRY